MKCVLVHFDAMGRKGYFKGIMMGMFCEITKNKKEAMVFQTKKKALEYAKEIGKNGYVVEKA